MVVTRPLRNVFSRPWLSSLLAGILFPLSAAAGSLDRLKAVSDHAKQRVSGGPEHLWVGVGIFVVLALVVIVGAWWALGRKKG